MKRLLALVLLIALPSVSAQIALDNIQYDPAIIAAGDDVDIVIQYHVEQLGIDSGRISNPDYKFRVTLLPDDELTKNYVIVTDAEGDDLFGSLFQGGQYNKRFSVKVLNNAPAGNYEFKLVGQWYRNGVPEESEQFVRFMMPVKKEGIILDVAQLTTLPADVRPGDEYVEIRTTIANVGEKDAKSVEVNLEIPDGFEHSYTDMNRQWIGTIGAGESEDLTLFVDVDEYLAPGTYELTYTIDYLDFDNNAYTKQVVVPFFIKARPYLEVVSSEGTGKAGESTELRVTVKNTGTESAEAVDVRLLKKSAQPFIIDVRSEYLGELQPGEQATAVFTVDVLRDAPQREHDLTVLIRSKGDSDEGDDDVYTYTRNAKLVVEGQAMNKLLIIGAVAVVIVIAVLLWRRK